MFIIQLRSGYAQLYDAQWVIGPVSSKLDFRNDTVTLDTLPNYIPFFLTSACISDESGNLLYTCYGPSVTDKYGATLQNGDSLSPCQYTYQHGYAFQIQQGALFIPVPGNHRFYYLLHCSNDTLTNTRPGTLYYSIIDKEGNFGLGAVVEKNHVIYGNGVFRGGGMTACKHANGRDWWVTIGGGLNSNKYYTFLLTSTGITDSIVQNIGPIYSLPYDNSYSCFSEDGSKYATIAYNGYLSIFDFDRCTGLLSNPVKIFNNTSTDTIHTFSGGGPIAFSSNGRFIYLSDRVNLVQYDLWSTNIQDSSIVYEADSGDYALIRFVKLAPNGKIYGSTWSGSFYFLHVVNRPDEKGDSCEFVYAGQPTLSNNSYNLPNMPNYRLGALAGSGCDTISGIAELEDRNYKPRMQPNPADKYLYVEMPQQGNYNFELLNESGQLIEQKQTRQVDVFNTEDLPGGIYFIKVSNRVGRLISTQRIVVRH